MLGYGTRMTLASFRKAGVAQAITSDGDRLYLIRELEQPKLVYGCANTPT